MRTRIAALAIAPLFLAGCGGGDSEGDKDSAAPAANGGMPACSEVWVEGETLPENYEGCDEGDAVSAPAISECGDAEWTSYNDEFYAKLGGEIFAVEGEMSDDPAYGKFYNECAGG